LKNSIRLILLLVVPFGLTWSCRTVDPTFPDSEIKLGEKLFFDTQLSRDSTISCASCHKPEFAFADNQAFSKGIKNQLAARNTPSSINVSAHTPFFWDGRAETIEEQALGPIESRAEMDLPISDLVKRLNANHFYKKAFYKVYGASASKELIVKALAAFESSLETADTPFDHYMQGDTNAMSAAARRGQLVFNQKGKCFDCHFGPDFTGDEFKNIGLFDGKSWNDSGRYLISKDLSDLGKFKTPGLRNIEKTAPYMHNGRFKTLEEVIDYYNNPSSIVPAHQNRDNLLSQPLGLSLLEKSDLLAFLKALTDKKFR
jgi:cytochrome c peroxidase